MTIYRYNKANQAATAFSLIELSIVILIIGIIIAGVTQGSRLVKFAKVNTEATQTKSAPVASVAGLVSWFETTLPNSFSEDVGNDDAIAEWLDISPQSSSKNNASQSTSASQPLYIDSGINGLPALRFDGVDDVLTAGGIVSGLSDYTDVFVEERAASTSGPMMGASPGLTLGYAGDDTSVLVYHSNGYNDLTPYTVDAYSSPTPRIMCFTNKVTSDTSGDSDLYINGFDMGVAGRLLQGENSSYSIGYGPVGSGVYYQGYIGEIIIFNRQLKTEERKAIESYLAKKWKVTLS